MANELDPHHLLALMEFTFAKEEDLPTDLDSDLRGDHDTHARTFPVLDAIAGISVSETGSQVVAVALQLDSQRQEIRLTIATNQTVKDGLASHLSTVWGKLQALSKAYAEQRQRSSVGPHLDGRRSPEIPEDATSPLKLEIFRDIYQFCMRKQAKRMYRSLDVLKRLVVQLIQRRGDKDLPGFELTLFNIVVGSYPIARLLNRLLKNPGTQLEDHEWKTIYCHSLWIFENATPVLEGRNRCEILAQGFTGMPLLSPHYRINLNKRNLSS